MPARHEKKARRTHRGPVSQNPEAHKNMTWLPGLQENNTPTAIRVHGMSHFTQHMIPHTAREGSALPL